MMQVFDFIREGLADVLFLLIFVELIRRLDVNRTRLLLVLCVAGLAIALVLKTSIRYQMVDAVNEVIRASTEALDFSHKSSDQVRPELRERYSLAVARNVFRETGKLMTVTDAEGEMRLFAPSQAELLQREQYVVITAQLKTLRDSHRARFLREVGMLVGSLLVAIALVIDDRKTRRKPG